MRAFVTTLLLFVVLSACGGSGATDAGTPEDAGASCPAGAPSRTESSFEGALCDLASSDAGPGCMGEGGNPCGSGGVCTTYTCYQSATGVCRIPCDGGCPSGESCGQDGTCQCTPSATPCGSSDSCAAVGGMLCHPDFHVCMTPEAAGSCASGLNYSPLWHLCRAQQD